MFGKKQPILTGRYCDRMEKLRQAIEVLNGHRAIFIHIDFNTGKARFLVGGVEINVVFIFAPDDLINFLVETDAGLAKNDWYVARFDFEPGEVRVISEHHPVKRGKGHSMWWAGCSATERRLEPLDKDEAEYCAKVRGLTLEEYLNS